MRKPLTKIEAIDSGPANNPIAVAHVEINDTNRKKKAIEAHPRALPPRARTLRRQRPPIKLTEQRPAWKLSEALRGLDLRTQSGCLPLGSGHFAATLGASPAGLGAKHHGLVVGETRAVLGAHLADAGTNTAGHLMHRRTAQHEIGGGDADLGAVLHQPDVVGSGMLTAFVQAMRNGREANGVAVKAVGDAVLHGCHGDFARTTMPQSIRSICLR